MLFIDLRWLGVRADGRQSSWYNPCCRPLRIALCRAKQSYVLDVEGRTASSRTSASDVDVKACENLIVVVCSYGGVETARDICVRPIKLEGRWGARFVSRFAATKSVRAHRTVPTVLLQHRHSADLVMYSLMSLGSDYQCERLLASQ